MRQFPKVHILKSRKVITSLFTKAKRVKQNSVTLLYLPSNKTKVAFSVPKRKVRLAVNRQRIKRQMREVYRTNQLETDQPYSLLFIYQKSTEITFTTLTENIKQCLTSLKK